MLCCSAGDSTLLTCSLPLCVVSSPVLYSPSPPAPLKPSENEMQQGMEKEREMAEGSNKSVSQRKRKA